MIPEKIKLLCLAVKRTVFDYNGFERFWIH